MDTGTRAQVRAVAEIFGGGGSATSTSAKIQRTRDGSLEACQDADPGATSAPAQCAALLRLELVGITSPPPPAVKAQAEPERAVPVAAVSSGCPVGLMMQNGKCVRASATAVRQCPAVASPDAVRDCATQCERGHGGSCHNLGYFYEKGLSVGRDDAVAARHYQRALDLGFLGSADNLGDMIQAGRGGPVDLPKAAAIYKRGCDGNVAACCTDLGLAHRRGRGVPVDDVKAVALYRKGCDGGNSTGCNNLGAMYHGGIGGLPVDKALASSLFERACNMGAPLGCYNFGTVLVGRGNPTDRIHGVALIRAACAAKVDVACAKLRELNEPQPM
jgi:TPR repeat protein